MISDRNVNRFWKIAIPVMAVLIPLSTLPDIKRLVHYAQKKMMAKSALLVWLSLTQLLCQVLTIHAEIEASLTDNTLVLLIYPFNHDYPQFEPRRPHSLYPSYFIAVEFIPIFSLLFSDYDLALLFLV